MNQKSVLGIIPARGGSKGVPRKNIRPLCGRPLITYTVEAALKTNSLDRVIVSTDDEEIADIARENGAEVPFLRPREYATDRASCILLIHHALNRVSENEQYIPDAIAFLPPTSPLRTAEQIDDTVGLLWKSGLDSAVTICPVQNHPYYIYSLDKDNKLTELVKAKNKALCRQELPVYYTHSQSVIASLTSYIKRCTTLDLEFNLCSVAGLQIDCESALDIDTLTDFLVAEAIMNQGLTKSNNGT